MIPDKTEDSTYTSFTYICNRINQGEMKIEQIKEVADLLKFVKSYSQLPSEMIYRGQNQDWNLLPSLFRNDKESNLRVERELFRRLKLNKPQLPSDLEDSFDFLIFAQQYSMPTRLLDWTYSPLIALWFACFNKNNDFSNDGIICIMDSTRLFDARKTFTNYNESEDTFKTHLDGIGSLQKLIPSPLFNRLTSQHGIFTIFPNEAKIDELEITKVLIPANEKATILNELEKLKINEYTIFRDFDSLCRTLYSEVYRNKILHQDHKPEPPEFFDTVVM